MSVQAYDSSHFDSRAVFTSSSEKIGELTKILTRACEEEPIAPSSLQMIAKIFSQTAQRINNLALARQEDKTSGIEDQQQLNPEKAFKPECFVVFTGNLEAVEALIRKKKPTQEMLHAAILRNSEILVEKILQKAEDKNRLISRLTIHLAQCMNNKEIIEELNAISPFLWEENTAFTVSEFRELLQCFADYPMNKVELNFSGHAELTDDCFLPQEWFQKITLKKLNLFGCVGITDQALRSIASGFPCLEEIYLGAERCYEDIEILIAQAQGAPFPWETSMKAKKEYDNYEKRQQKISKEGLKSLAGQCKELKLLSLTYCSFLHEDVDELFVNLENFPALTFLDLSDCYGVTQAVIEKIRKARPQLVIRQERIFASQSLPYILGLTGKKRHHPIQAENVLSKLRDAIRSQDLSQYLSILVKEEMPIEEPVSPTEQIEEEDLESLIYSSMLEKNRDELGDPSQTSQDALEMCLAILKEPSSPTLPAVESKPMTEPLMEQTEEKALLYAHKLEEILREAASRSDFLFLYELIKSNAVFKEAHLNLAVESNPNVESIRLILETAVLPSRETFILAIRRQDEKILRLLLDAIYVLPRGVLDFAVEHLYNKPFYIQKMLQKRGDITDKTLSLAVKHNHFRVINLLLHWRALPTPEILSQAIQRKNPDPAVISLLENCLQWMKPRREPAISREF